MRTIFITGGTGFIGTALTQKLLNNGFKIKSLTRAPKQTFNHPNLYYVDAQLSTDLLAQEMQGSDGVIHLATYYCAQHSSQDIETLINSNLLLSTKVAEASKLSKVKWFVNVGTFWQYANSESYAPANLYAATKEAFESVLKYYEKFYSITNVKLNDTYGPSDSRPKIFNLWKNLVNESKSLDMSAGEQYVDFTHIDDITNAFFVLVNLLQTKHQKHHGITYGICTMNRVTLKQLAQIFENVSQKKLNINWGVKPYRENEIMNPWTPEHFIPGWKPKVSLEQGILSIL
ncbi:MAG: NAD(P)-dependent oxidoreductase [Candidatus Cloacimonetes bacterium]|nr:NAD(P)-dependent oxidoreductase [Candidatus Cloacimonadota bacterium]